MINVEEAKKIIRESIIRGKSTKLSIQEAQGLVLSKNVNACFNSPPFSSSAMDGYGVDYLACPGEFLVNTCMAAGDKPKLVLKKGEAIRIMTGAMIPKGVNAVIQQEDVTKISENKIVIKREIKKSENIRFEGEELKKGELLLSQGSILTPAAIGLLASQGIFKVDVYNLPKIAIIPTGNELILNKRQMKTGRIFESNSFALQALLKKNNIPSQVFAPVPDDPKLLNSVFKKAIENFDFIVLTGGVSVGSFDYVKDVLAKLKVKTLFWKVAQKPGKPLFFGKCQSKYIFGLPGNPAAALVCAYEYLQPAINQWLGMQESQNEFDKAILGETFTNKSGRTNFVRAIAKSNSSGLVVYPVTGQDSHRMQSFAQSDCLFSVPAEKIILKQGEEVIVRWV